jgi:hypothetical protein
VYEDGEQEGWRSIAMDVPEHRIHGAGRGEPKK